MHRLFGKPKAKVEAPSLDSTSSAIGGRMADLENKIKGLDNELRVFKEQLKKASGSTAAQLKKRATDVLRRKRMYEQQRDQLANQQFNIDQTAFAVNTVKDTQQTVAAMSAAAKTLKKEQKKININDIENMQDEMEDLLEDVGEISEILGRSYGMPDGIDEADLDAELACLEDEWAAEEVTTANSVPATSASYEASIDFDTLPAQPSQQVNVASAPASRQQTNPAVSSHSYV